MRYSLLLSLGLSICPSLHLACQEPSSSAGSVRGTVYDSLLRQPIVGAEVWIDSAAHAVTDHRGHFHLTGVPAGDWVLRFANPALDSLGIPQFTHQVRVTPGHETHADLGVPSLETFYRHLCSRRLPTAAHGTPLASIVVGTILDAASGRRVSRAQIQASWLTAEGEGPPYFGTRTIETLTDSVGGFVLCGLPVGQSVSMIASAGPDLTGVVDVPVNARHLAVQNLYVSLDSSETDSATGLRRGSAVLLGEVRSDGGPIADVELNVEGAAAASRTGPDGLFLLERLPAGTQVLMARAVGYGAVRRILHLRAGDTVRLTVGLRRLTTLDTIRIVGHRNRDVVALMERLDAGYSFAMVGQRLMGAQDVPTLLATVPGLAVDGPPNLGCSLGMRNDAHCFRILRGRNQAGFVSSRECRAKIWVDGHPASEVALGMIQPADLVAVEWFPDPATLPMRYAGSGDCALLLVWTRALR